MMPTKMTENSSKEENLKKIDKTVKLEFMNYIFSIEQLKEELLEELKKNQVSLEVNVLQ